MKNKTYQPAEETFRGYLSKEPQIVARNCRVDDLNVTGAVLGGAWAPNTEANAYYYDSSSSVKTLQLKAQCTDALKCVHITLAQLGNDVTARIDDAAYTSPKQDDGFLFPTCVPIAANANADGYGVAKLYYATSTLSSLMGMVSCSFNPSFNGFLSVQEDIVAINVRLDDIKVTGAVLGGSWAQGVDAKPVFERRTGTEICIQLQSKHAGYLKCVHITLRQSGNNVVAKCDWAAALCPKWGLEWAEELEVEDIGFDFSMVNFVPIAKCAEDEGYGVSELSFLRCSDLSHVSVRLNNKAKAATAIRVKVSLDESSYIDGNDIRIGLHWLNEDGSYPSVPALIADKKPERDRRYRDTFMAEFTFEEVAQKTANAPYCPKHFFPVIFFTEDGSYDNAWFRTDLEGAKKTPGMIFSFRPGEAFSKLKDLWHNTDKAQRTQNKLQIRAREEQMRAKIANAAFLYLDGNNFCWENFGSESRNIGIARLDFILKELKKAENKCLFPNASIKLFFDGGITRGYPIAFLKSLNNGNVTVVSGKADRPILDESSKNGDTERTFVVSGDRFTDYPEYSVVKNGRVIHPEFNDCTIRIPGLLNEVLSFDPNHYAHLPLPRSEGFLFTNDVYIQAYSNKKYLRVDDQVQDSGKPILANGEAPSPEGRFRLVKNNDGTISIRSSENGKYLTAMVNPEGNGRLMLLADKIDLWEKFWLTKRINGDHFILRSHANMKYVTAYRDDGRVAAQADIADEWEWLIINACS